MIHCLRYMVNNDHKYSCNCPPDSEYRNYTVMVWWNLWSRLIWGTTEQMLKLYNFYNYWVMACNDPFLIYMVNNDHKYNCNWPPFSEYRTCTVMAWWYVSLPFIFGEVEHMLNLYNFYNHQVMACNDPFLEISGE